MDKLKLKEISEQLFKFHMEIAGFYNEYAKSKGLTLAGLKVLSIIQENKNCSQKTIIRYTYLPKQTVSAIIKSLREQNIIEFDINQDTDKRNKIIKLTREGEKIAEQVVNGAKEIQYRALDSLGEEKRKNLLEALTIFKDNLKII